MSIQKEDYLQMKKSQYYTWDLFFEYWEDKGGHSIPLADFSQIMANIFPQLGPNGDILILRIVEHFDAKFFVTKIISKNGELINEY